MLGPKTKKSARLAFFSGGERGKTYRVYDLDA